MDKLLFEATDIPVSSLMKAHLRQKAPWDNTMGKEQKKQTDPNKEFVPKLSLHTLKNNPK